MPACNITHIYTYVCTYVYTDNFRDLYVGVEVNISRACMLSNVCLVCSLGGKSMFKFFKRLHEAMQCLLKCYMMRYKAILRAM